MKSNLTGIHNGMAKNILLFIIMRGTVTVSNLTFATKLTKPSIKRWLNLLKEADLIDSQLSKKNKKEYFANRKRAFRFLVEEAMRE